MTALKESSSHIELHFKLNVVQAWPPVAVEGVLCTLVGSMYSVETPPLFVKGISVGDIIEVEFDGEDHVTSWRAVSQSDRTTARILRTGPGNNIAIIISDLQSMDCRVIQLPELGCYSVDIPGEVPIADIDACLARLDSNSTAVAFPSYRHK